MKLSVDSTSLAGTVTYKATIRGDDNRIILSGTGTTLKLATQAALKRLKTLYDTAVTQAVAAKLISNSTDLG